MSTRGRRPPTRAGRLSRRDDAVPDLGARGRAPVDGHRTLEPGALGRHPAGVVARIGLVLVGSVVLLVDDDHPQVGHGGKDGRPGSHDDARLAGGDATVLGAPASGAETAVQHGHGAAEPRGEPRRDLRRECDLGNEHDRAATELERVLDQAQIDLGLARPRHAVDEDISPAALQHLDARRDGRLLGRGELDADVRSGRGRHGLEGHEAAVPHPPNGLPGRPGRRDQVGQRHRRKPGMRQDLGLARGRSLAAQHTHPGVRRAGLGGGRGHQRERPGEGRGVRCGDPLRELEQADGHIADDIQQRLQGRHVARTGERGHDAADAPRAELDLDHRAAADLAVELRRDRVVERPVDSPCGHERDDGRDRTGVRRGRAHPGRTRRAAPRRGPCAPRGSPRRCGRNGRRRPCAGRSAGAGRAPG